MNHLYSKSEIKTIVSKKDAPGMKGYRTRNTNGELRRKRGDTYIGTIEKEYGLQLNVRSDMNLSSYLGINKINSLNDLILKK